MTQHTPQGLLLAFKESSAKMHPSLLPCSLLAPGPVSAVVPVCRPCKLLHGAHVDLLFLPPRAFLPSSSALLLSSSATFIGNHFPSLQSRTYFLNVIHYHWVELFPFLLLVQSVISNYRLIWVMARVCLYRLTSPRSLPSPMSNPVPST